ncbi:MAG TPA: sterol desaturase family protein [Oligoflexus sp.]|uniref:sterol desaturase family protein n=1 Tax=Oligoflexus sp. TaxID=1971216 RepID=UPI002D2DA3CA|nr:sterol desaturase family protein [Oligoflexus sp.]HYX31566.1 sterol desaturase family protein [Oligoflexus sp.]
MVPKAVIFYAMPFFMFLIVWEIYRFRKNQRNFPWMEALVSLLMAAAYTVINTRSTPIIASANEWFYSLRLFDIPANTIWGLGLLFLGEELAYYWLHRCAHEIRWLWASHNVHHSPETMTLSGAYRLSITGPLSGLFLFFVPLFILGFSPVAVAGMFGFNLVYQFWLHTEWIPKLGWFEYIFNTPSHHRVHHATDAAYIDRNYGGVLIIFDRLFGTFAEEKASIPLNYGLIGKKPTLNPLTLFFQEWAALFRDVVQARNWHDRFYLAFGRPGWQPKPEKVTAPIPLIPVRGTMEQETHESRTTRGRRQKTG